MELRTRNPKQAKAWEILFNDNGIFELLYGGAKGGAKTYTGCTWVTEMCGSYPGVNYFIARHELNDLRKYTLPSIIEVFQHHDLDFNKLCSFNGQDNIINFWNGSKIFFLACKHLPSDPLFERFGSMQMTGGWAEEAGEISKEALTNLRISIGRWNNAKYNIPKKFLITSNPKKNHLKTDFITPYKKGELSKDKAYIQAFVKDNKHINNTYIDNLDKLTGIDRQRLLLGDWDYDDSKDQLINYNSILSLFTNNYVQPTGKKGIICDVAGYGSDRFVILVVDGCKAIDIDVNAKDPKESLLMIKRFVKKYKVPEHRIVYDADGVGQLFKLHFPGARGILNNSTKYAKNYQNKKTRLAYELAEAINDNKLHFDIPNFRLKDELIEELCCLKRKDADKDGKLRIIPKEEVKQMIGRSPDLLDVMIYWMLIINEIS